MNPIPNSFQGTRDQRGFHFTLLKRSGTVALFQKSHHLYTHKLSYEVVLLQQSPEKTWPDGRVTDAHEKMPKPEDWGVLGWTMTTLESANQKFIALSSKPFRKP